MPRDPGQDQEAFCGCRRDLMEDFMDHLIYSNRDDGYFSCSEGLFLCFLGSRMIPVLQANRNSTDE